MRKNNITITFHNPNSELATIKFLSKVITTNLIENLETQKENKKQKPLQKNTFNISRIVNKEELISHNSNKESEKSDESKTVRLRYNRT